jgi:hypothetical protein
VSDTRCVGCDVPLKQPATGRRRKWCSPRCRKATLYGGTCKTCGAPTSVRKDGTAGGDECFGCAIQRKRDERRWTRAVIVAAILRFADLHGRAPTAREWQVAERGDYPHASAVQREFVTWAAAIEAAGFKTRMGHYVRDPRPGDRKALAA